MKKRNQIQFVLGTKGTIPSVNAVYKAKIIYKYGKPVPVLYKDSVALKITEEINEQLRQIDFKELAPWIFKKDAVFNLTIQFIFKQSFFKRDLDNLMKVTQDAIFRFFGLNDSRVIELHTFKSILPDAKEEKICVALSESGSEIRFDKLQSKPSPELIWTNDLEAARDILGNWNITDTDQENADCYVVIDKGNWADKEKYNIIQDAIEAKQCGDSIFLITQDPDLSEMLGWIGSGSLGIKAVKDISELTDLLGEPKKKRKTKK